MDYHKLGRSGLKVSPLCLGTMLFGAQTDEPTSQRINQSISFFPDQLAALLVQLNFRDLLDAQT